LSLSSCCAIAGAAIAQDSNAAPQKSFSFVMSDTPLNSNLVTLFDHDRGARLPAASAIGKMIACPATLSLLLSVNPGKG
jgi:hypothetical protein